MSFYEKLNKINILNAYVILETFNKYNKSFSMYQILFYFFFRQSLTV